MNIPTPEEVINITTNEKSLLRTDLLRFRAISDLDKSKRSTLGQFFTPAPIAQFMASLFSSIQGDVRLLEPGCGVGSLFSAFVDEALERGEINSLHISAYDVEKILEPFINEALSLCETVVAESGRKLTSEHHMEDFILDISNSLDNNLSSRDQKLNLYTHVIINPPYKKIASTSIYRKALRHVGIETVNLYTGFVALAIKLLQNGGELVAIIPRSFCNGPYYQPFREFLLSQTSIEHIHIFESRNKAFTDDDVLQENIIIHCIKKKIQSDVLISSSPSADFYEDEASGEITVNDMTIRTVEVDSIVKPNDRQKFIHIAPTKHEQNIVDRLSCFNQTLSDLGVEVSTGPVVDFRLKEELRVDFAEGNAPLLYPIHMNGIVEWPKESKKPNAINVSEKTRPWLWENKGNFVITRRFSSKEEKRRIVATFYDSSLPGELIGFDNKLNVFHRNKVGIERFLAKGLFVYLNCTLIDKYYRQFGGHTQVNATDLRALHYPSIDILKRMGKNLKENKITQQLFDEIVEDEINRIKGGSEENPLMAQKYIEQAIEILIALGMPKAQQNDRSALTLLALINLHPNDNWQKLERKMMGVTPIMDWCRDVYGKEYAPNTRETFRRQTLHQFVDGGLCLYNPDKPERPVNSPKACYQITIELFDVLVKYDTNEWHEALDLWLRDRETLVAQYAMEREKNMVPLTLDDGTEVKLSPGVHSQLIRDIVEEFGPRFAPGSEVIYLGDTGAKEELFRKKRLAELGVVVDRKGKLPDVVLYWPDKDWLLMIESVTSHGPVDGKRHSELSTLFNKATPGLVYVTAFPDRKTMAKYIANISWETEVWTADAPTHMIHFNGDRFLGPHK